MSDYIKKELSKIFDETKFEFPLNLAMASAWIAGNFKGTELKIYDVRGRSTLCDYFVLSSAGNATQLHAMADEMMGQMKANGTKLLSVEGMDGNWVLLDFGDIIVHLFLHDARFVYDLDELWKTAPQVTIPQSYYFSEAPSEKLVKKDEDENYF